MLSRQCCSLKSGVASAACTTSPVWRIQQAAIPAVRRPLSTVQTKAVAVKSEVAEAPAAAASVNNTEEPEVAPTTQQVEDFLTTLVQETEIAELHLQMGSFELRVRRSTKSAAPAYAPPPPVAAAPAAAPAAMPSLASTSSAGVSLMEESVDESLVYVTSPKVGIFRRGRYAGGKKVGKGNCVNQGDQVKKGQTLGFVEQLGTHVVVEAPQAGELAKMLLEDGAPVEYQQLVAELAPFFGGHIIGDRKYA